MSGSIQGAGNQPVNYDSPSIGQSSEAGKAVGSGLIGNNSKLQMMQGQKAITNSQLAHRPTLLKPKEMGMQAQASANQAASADLLGLGKMTKAASQDVGSTMVRAQLGMQTAQDQEMFQRNAKTLASTSNYIESLFKGKDQLTRDDKATLLGGQGFDDQQIDDLLLSQSDRAAFKTKAQAKHGNAYNQRIADLKSMGYDDHQADMILSLGDDNLMRNDLRKEELSKIFKNNPEAKKLAAMGFDERKIQELLNLANKGFQPKGSMVGNEKMMKLLDQMGFGEKEAKILLATGNPEKLKEQLTLMKRMEGFPDVSKKMLKLAESAETMAKSPMKPFLEEHLKQQADIFMVLELIHQMSVEQRRFARESRSAEYDAAKNEVLKQADHIRIAAVLTLAADVIQGGMSIRGGLASMKAGAKGGTKGPKTGTGKGNGSSIDDVQVSSGKKSKGKLDADDFDDVDGASSGKRKKKRSGDSDIDGNSTAQRNNRSNRQTEASKKQNKQMEKDAQKADQKRSEAELENQQTEAMQNKNRKKEVTIDQNKEADQNKATQKESNKAQEDQANQNQIAGNNAKAMALGQVSQGIGQFAGGMFKFMAARESALQKESEAHQKTHENAAQAWSEWMQLQQDQVKNCQSKIDEINRIHFDTLKSLSRG